MKVEREELHIYTQAGITYATVAWERAVEVEEQIRESWSILEYWKGSGDLSGGVNHKEDY